MGVYMKAGNLDKSSCKYLKYIYHCKDCTYRELSSHFGLNDMEDLIIPTVLLALFIKLGYIVAIRPNGTYICFLNFDSEFFSGNALTSPDTRFLILPEGAYYVEQTRQKSYSIWLPIIIAASSLVISFFSLVYS